MALHIEKLSSEPIEGVAFKSNLSTFKGSVYGGETFGIFDGFINITNWFYEYSPLIGELVVWKEIDIEDRYVVFTNIFDIKELSFTFDKQMLSVVSYIKQDKCFVYFFDSSLNEYTTLEIPEAKTPKVALNSIHFSHTQDSNVILAYVSKEKKLCIRYQRDRYSKEYVVLNSEKKIKLFNIGYANTNRFQYELLESAI